MKRFFAIFGICFGSLVVFLGGYLGVKWLIGDFNPKLIPPEKIEFQQSEYYFDEGQESYNLLITTSTEGVTETKVTLQFSTNGKQAADKNFWTDGVIVIPKVVTLNKPFEVTLVKDNTYASEVDDAALNNWIRGGISNIIATSEHNLTPPATTTIYVDTPVYKTELVVLNNEQNEFNFTNAFKNVEHSNFSTILNNNVSNIRAGETFYVALKYYPSASAFKYNKISSTNALVQYKNDILAKLAELGLNSESYFSELNQLCENEQPKNIDDVLTLYKQLISSENESLNSYIENLLVNFNKNLKYNALLEKTNIENKVNIVGKVNGTNLYEVVATQNLGRAEFYSYSFYKSSVENQELNNFGAVDYDVLEAAFENGTAIRNTNAVNVVDVEVDTITLSGSIDSIRAGDVFTIYANKSGTNNIKTAYLNIDLSNSTLSDIDLKDKVVNVGIRFEKKLGVDWVDASSDITLKNIENYQAIKIYDDNGNLKETYYRPYGSAHYWEVYANNYAEGEFRAVIKYFIEYYTTIKETIKNPQTGEDEIVDKIITCYEEILIDEKNYSYPTFSLRETSSETENMISWVNTQEVKQEIVEIYGSVSLSNPVTVIPEYDLSNLVNRESLNQNVYTTTRYFIYSNEGDEVLSDYFNTVNSEAITYTFANGSFKLYELPTSVLKLKSSQAVPEYAVMAVFMTVKTDINGAPIYEDQQIGKYEYVKYSAVKDNMLERLSPIKFTFEKSLSTLTGKIEIVDNYVADYVNIYNGDDLRQEFWLAKDTPNILIVQIESPEGEEDKFQRAIQDGKISVVAKSNIGDVNNYVNYVIDETRDGISTFYISTKRVENDSQVSIFIVYSIDGVDYYFQVNYTTDVLVSIEPITFEEKTFEYFIIKSNTSSKAAFNIKHLHKDDIINYVTSSKNIKNITIQRIYSEVDGLYDSYTINFVDGYNCGHTSENIIFDKNCVFNSDGTIRAEITNFLMNNDKTTKWHLTSSNTAVAKITEDKIVTFVGSGEVEISLFVDGINEAQDVIKFIFIDNGYVSEYAYTTLGQNTIVTGFNNTDNVYTSRALPLSQLGYAGSKIILRDSNTNINNNTALLSMWYYIEDGDQVENNNNKKLNFKVVLDENSIDVYKQLFDANYSEGDNLPNELTLKNNLGAPTTLNLIYVHEQIDITIRVSLTISAVINIEKFIVKNSSGNSVAPVDSYADEFNVYAGHNYALDVELGGEFKDSQELVYLLKDKNGNFKPVSTSTSGIRLVNKDNGMYCFDDVSEETEVVIYVSTTQTPQIGDLQKAITFNVSPNVEISNYVAENNYEIHIELLDNGKASYDLLDATKGLFARKVSNSNNLDIS
ncbi:MAG: hypothetical protein IJW25_01235, partial [Clostridia bacterium]|nr:hypothetical protein [Clostridia bacterium]